MLRSTLIIFGTILLFQGCAPEAPHERLNIFFLLRMTSTPICSTALPEKFELKWR